MKRYLLFVFPAGMDMYGSQPGGGWHDFMGSYDTIQAARDAVIAGIYERRDSDDHTAQIVDVQQGRVVETGAGEYDPYAAFIWSWKETTEDAP